jgi:hypothetical protein
MEFIDGVPSIRWMVQPFFTGSGHSPADPVFDPADPPPRSVIRI